MILCECGGGTQVVDTRGEFRRRECLQCKKRFTTEEIKIARARAQKQVVRTRPDGVPPPKLNPRSKINAAPEIKHQAQIKQNRAARNRLEDMREERELRGLLDDDYDYTYDAPDNVRL